MTIRKTLILLLIIVSPFVGFSQQKGSVITQGSAKAELTRDKSLAEAEKEAEKMAIVNALEKAFGRVVVQGNSTYIQNINTGQNVETNSVFNMIANTSVKGEVDEIISKKFTEIEGKTFIDGEHKKAIYINCDIKLRAREIEVPRIEFNAFPLKCMNINCQSTSFIDGEDMFFYFNSPVSGYLTIFLDDGNVTQCLLPYSHMPPDLSDNFPVKANTAYILFSASPKYHYFNDLSYSADEIQLYAESPEDINRLFVIFTKVQLNKPKLYDDLNKELLNDYEQSNGYTMPKSLPSEDFQRWLIKTRSFLKSNAQVQIIDITIRKK